MHIIAEPQRQHFLVLSKKRIYFYELPEQPDSYTPGASIDKPPYTWNGSRPIIKRYGTAAKYKVLFIRFSCYCLAWEK